MASPLIVVLCFGVLLVVVRMVVISFMFAGFGWCALLLASIVPNWLGL
jgi:hypothetical protein